MELKELIEKLRKEEKRIRQRAEDFGIQIEKEPSEKIEPSLKAESKIPLRPEIESIPATSDFGFEPVVKQEQDELKAFLTEAESLLNSIDMYSILQAKRKYADLLMREPSLPKNIDHHLESDIERCLFTIGKRIQQEEKEPSEKMMISSEVFVSKPEPMIVSKKGGLPDILNYVMKRALFVAPVLLAVSFIVFMLVYLCPGDAIDRSLNLTQAISDAPDIEEFLHLKHIFGLDQPWYIQYYCWLRQAVSGNLGHSFLTGRPVVQEVIERMPNTLSYQITALILSVLISVPAGVISAVKRNTQTDAYIVMGSLFGASFPPFVIGLLLIFLFTLWLGWFPFGGTHSLEFLGGNIPHDLSYYLDYLKHLILPTITLTLATTGYTTRLVRSSMLTVLQEDYILTARSKGLKERTVIYKHALKNAILPIVTIIGLRIAFMLSGAPVIEIMFSWPGLGKFFVDAMWMRDYFSVIGAAIFMGVVIVVVNLMVDISYKWLDPRIEL
jgi:peptide/nickel transport system permease protein